jgi:hypothetical protein
MKEQEKIEDLKKVITGTNLWVNGLGWLTLGLSFEEDGEFFGNSDDWTITHINEGYNYEILDWLLAALECSLNSLKGKTVILRGKAVEYRQNGEISFDNGETFFDIDKKKAELDAKWHKYHDEK